MGEGVTADPIKFSDSGPSERLDRARRNERAIEEDVLEHVRRGGAEPIGVGCRAIAQMPVVAIAVVGRIAGYRQEGDALLWDFDPLPLARQEFEAPAVLAIRSHGAIRAAAAQLAVLAVHAGVDVVRTDRGERGSNQGPAESGAKKSIHHVNRSCWRPTDRDNSRCDRAACRSPS